MDMPTYSYTCTCCDLRFDDILPMSADSSTTRCPECNGTARKQVTAPAAVRGDSYDWTHENNGKGRRISQLDKSPREPYYAKSRQTAIDEAHRRGLYVHKV